MPTSFMHFTNAAGAVHLISQLVSSVSIARKSYTLEFSHSRKRNRRVTSTSAMISITRDAGAKFTAFIRVTERNSRGD